MEQNPEDYWKGVVRNTRTILSESKLDPGAVMGIVFSTQAMGIIALDREDKPLMNNITWVDGRAEEQAKWLMGLLGGKKIFEKLIGVEITGKDVIPKLRWIKQNRPEIYRQSESHPGCKWLPEISGHGQKGIRMVGGLLLWL